jgi:hypothetical protein
MTVQAIPQVLHALESPTYETQKGLVRLKPRLAQRRDRFPLTNAVVDLYQDLFLRDWVSVVDPYGYYEVPTGQGWWTVSGVARRNEYTGYPCLIDRRLWVRYAVGRCVVGRRWIVEEERPLSELLVEFDARTGVAPPGGLDDDQVLDYVQAFDRVLRTLTFDENLTLAPRYWSSGHRSVWIGFFFDGRVEYPALCALRDAIAAAVAGASEALRDDLELDISNLMRWPCRLPGSWHFRTGRHSLIFTPEGPAEDQLGALADMADRTPAASVAEWYERRQRAATGKSRPGPGAAVGEKVPEVALAEVAISPRPSALLRPYTGRRLRLDGEGKPQWESLEIPSPLDGQTNEALITSMRLWRIVRELEAREMIEVAAGPDQPLLVELREWILDNCYAHHSGSKARKRRDHLRRTMGSYLERMLRGEDLGQWKPWWQEPIMEMAGQLEAQTGLPAEHLFAVLSGVLWFWLETGNTSFTLSALAARCGWGRGGRSRERLGRIMRAICAGYDEKRPGEPVDKPLLRLYRKGSPGFWSVYDPIWKNWHPKIAEGRIGKHSPEAVRAFLEARPLDVEADEELVEEPEVGEEETAAGPLPQGAEGLS